MAGAELAEGALILEEHDLAEGLPACLEADAELRERGVSDMASLHIDATRTARAADPERALTDGREYGISMGFVEESPALARVLEKLHRVDVVVGKGPGATAIPLQLPRFTLVGATTRAGLLPSPLRDRFGFTAHLDFYEESELEEVLSRSAVLLGLTIDKKAIAEIASRSRGTPRIANRLLRRVRDYAQVNGSNSLSHSDARAALEMYEVDEQGLDRLDRSVLLALIERFNGGPVGLSTLAIAVGEEVETVESVAEPFLVRNGFMARTPRGRVATAAGFSHVGRTPPPGLATLFDTPTT